MAFLFSLHTLVQSPDYNWDAFKRKILVFQIRQLILNTTKCHIKHPTPSKKIIVLKRFYFPNRPTTNASDHLPIEFWWESSLLAGKVQKISAWDII
tara:strand:- start:1577 stop:1864 length:288 start_codon:yes stop_codon:yes gene_type:complete